MPLIIDMSSPVHTLPQLDPILEQTAVNTGIIAIVDARYEPMSEKHLKHMAFYLGPDSPAVPKEILRQTQTGGNCRQPEGAEPDQGVQEDSS